MSKFFNFGKNKSLKIETRARQAEVLETGTGKKGINIVIALLICAVGVGYMIEINSVSTKGYAIRDLENKIDELKESNEKKEIKIAKMQSMQEIQNKVSKLGMVNIEKIDYIARPEQTFAVK